MGPTPIGGSSRTVASATPQGANPAMVKAAQEFESIFVQQLVKTMRQASEVSGSGGILSGKKTRLYRDMLDEEMAKAVAQQRGLGVADFVLKDMLRRKADQKKDSSSPTDVPIVPAEAKKLQGGDS